MISRPEKSGYDDHLIVNDGQSIILGGFCFRMTICWSEGSLLGGFADSRGNIQKYGYDTVESGIAGFCNALCD